MSISKYFFNKCFLNKYLAVLLLLLPAAILGADFNLTVQTPNQAAQMKLGLVTIGALDERMSCITDQIARDIELSGQFKLEIREGNAEITSVSMLKLFSQQQLPLVLFLEFTDQRKSEIQWRLYDTVNAQMLAGKKIGYRNLKLKNLAHEIADQVWLELVGQRSSFKTVIVGCQKIKKADGKIEQHVMAWHITDRLKSSAPVVPVCLVNAPTINFAPRFHPERPLLYFSQQTVRNVRLMSLDRQRHTKIVTDFNGLNLTPTISPTGEIVLTISWAGKSRLCKYKSNISRGNYKSLTGPEIHAVAPKFIDQYRILFCAINHKNVPRIAIYDLRMQDFDYISDHQYAIAPDYCAVNGKIAYCKKVAGVQQVFVGQLTAQNAVVNLSQLTYGKGDKDNCCWSPCGTYLLYSEELKSQSSLCLLNCLTQQVQYLTPAGEWWCFPIWSPVYMEIPFI